MKLFSNLKGMAQSAQKLFGDYIASLGADITNVQLQQILTGGQKTAAVQAAEGQTEGSQVANMNEVHIGVLGRMFSFLFNTDEAAALEAWASDGLNNMERVLLASRLKALGDPNTGNTLQTRKLRGVLACLSPESLRQVLKTIASSDMTDSGVADYLDAVGAIDPGLADKAMQFLDRLQEVDAKVAASLAGWDPKVNDWAVEKAKQRTRHETARRLRRDDTGWGRRILESFGTLPRKSIGRYVRRAEANEVPSPPPSPSPRPVSSGTGSPGAGSIASPAGIGSHDSGAFDEEFN